MKKLPLNPLVIFLFASISFHVTAQDAIFTQFYSNPVYYNPAMAGTAGNSRLALNYRSAWAPGSSTQIYSNFTASYDQPVGDSAGGIGFIIQNDKLGFENSIDAGGMYAHRFNIGKSYTLSTGIEAEYCQRILKGSWVVSPSGSTNADNGTFHDFADFSAGLALYGKNMYAGFSIDHFNQPNQYDETMPYILSARYTANAGILLPLNDYVSFSPNAIFIQQNYFRNLYAGCSMITQHIVTGAYWVFDFSGMPLPGMRDYDGIVLQAGYQSKFIKLCYSYNQIFENQSFNLSNHQLSLIIRFGHPSPKVKAIKCQPF